MGDLNVVALTGRLTRDMEVTYTNTGYAIGKFGLASGEYHKGSDGKGSEITSYFDINLFGKMAETMQNYLKKGKAVSVSGRLRQDRWERDGQKHSKVYVIADKVSFTNGSPRSASSSIYGPKGGYTNVGLPPGQVDADEVEGMEPNTLAQGLEPPMDSGNIEGSSADSFGNPIEEEPIPF